MKTVYCECFKDPVHGWQRCPDVELNLLIKGELAMPGFEGLVLLAATVELLVGRNKTPRVLRAWPALWRFNAEGRCHMHGYANAITMEAMKAGPNPRLRLNDDDRAAIARACGAVWDR